MILKKRTKKSPKGSIAQWFAYLLPNSAAPYLIPSNSIKFFIGKKLQLQHRCSAESGHWLENVGRTLLVLASGKLVFQKEPSLWLNRTKGSTEPTFRATDNHRAIVSGYASSKTSLTDTLMVSATLLQPSFDQKVGQFFVPCFDSSRQPSIMFLFPSDKSL